MVKVGFVSNSVVLSRTVGVILISRGYYVNHVFPSQISENGNNLDFNVVVIDFDGVEKISHGLGENVINKVDTSKVFVILITAEKSADRSRSFLKIGIKGIIDSSLKPTDVAEKIYEILQTLPIHDNDKRKHYRVKVQYGVLKVEITTSKVVEGNIFDISAGGVSANFNSYEEANMFINNKAYPCEIIFGNIVIKTKIFLVQRDGLFCGFKFFGLDDRQLIKLSEFIYHSIIESTYGHSQVSLT